MTIRQKLADELHAALEKNLVSIAEYGPTSSKGGLTPSLLVVLDSVSQDNLDLMREPIRDAMKQDAIGVMTLTENELMRSADVFPIKFRSIKQNGKTLHGKDLIAKMDVPNSHLRLRCEQELKNLSLRLRQKYLQAHSSPKQKLSFLSSVSRSLTQNLAVLAELKDGKASASQEELVSITREWDIDLELLERINELSTQENPTEPEVESVYHEFRSIVDKAAEIADRL
jgi:hypothetical protein